MKVSEGLGTESLLIISILRQDTQLTLLKGRLMKGVWPSAPYFFTAGMILYP